MPALAVTKFDVEALVDFQLSAEERERVWNAILSTPELEAYYIQIVAQKELVRAWGHDLISRKDRNPFLP
ncbi:MAG: hypothetical protein AAB276_09685 [Pseudomonadota bacterium]